MPKEADHFAAHTAKGVQAKLAPGIARKPTKDPLRDLQGFVTLDERASQSTGFATPRTMAIQQECRQGEEFVVRTEAAPVRRDSGVTTGWKRPKGRRGYTHPTAPPRVRITRRSCWSVPPSNPLAQAARWRRQGRFRTLRP